MKARLDKNSIASYGITYTAHMADPTEPSVCKADSIILQAVENLPPLDERFVSEKISNKRFKVGDTMILDTFGGKVLFTVLGLVTYCSEMKEDGKALVTEDTSIILLPSDATIKRRQEW